MNLSSCIACSPDSTSAAQNKQTHLSYSSSNTRNHAPYSFFISKTQINYISSSTTTQKQSVFFDHKQHFFQFHIFSFHNPPKFFRLSESCAMSISANFHFTCQRLNSRPGQVSGQVMLFWSTADRKLCLRESTLDNSVEMSSMIAIRSSFLATNF